MLTRFLLVLPFASLSVAAAAAQRPFTVDIMMQTEGVAEALFSPDGQRLLLEKIAAYNTSQNFAWERAWSRERSTLLDIQLGEMPKMRPVSPDAREHVWISSYSPSGAQAAIGWFDGDSAKAGVYDFRTGELRKFDVRISNSLCTFDCPYWLSEDRLLHYTLCADEQTKELSDNIYTDELTLRWSRHSWTGDEVAVKVLGSGAYASKTQPEGGQFILVDARSGKSTTVAQGIIAETTLSPDRRRFAVLRETGTLNMTGGPMLAIFGADRIFELAIYDFGQGGVRVLPCSGCNVTRGSLRWSPGGSKLFFAARTGRDGKFVHEHYIYDFGRGKLERFAPKGLAFATVESVRTNAYIVPFAWMDDDTPAVRVTRKENAPAAAAPGQEPKPRYDWFAVPAGRAPVNLTSGLTPVRDEKPLEDYVAAYKGRLLMMADGELWSVAANGRRTNLTRDIADAVSPWCSVISYWREAGMRPVCSGLKADFAVRPPDEAALKQGWLTLRVIKDDVPTGEVVFLNLDSGKTLRIGRPGVDAELVTASALAQSAVYLSKGADGDRLLLASAAAKTRELLHFNAQLKDVAGGTPVMLTRREPGEDKDRYDWLLLPPGHRPGERHPLLVYFYPDHEYSKEWRSDDLRAVSVLNQHIPAAHGYAVLLASMKISTMEKRGNPMTEMHGQLIHAAENVVREGYADDQRWAIMGHSYGGYGTAAVVSQTDRFKAAVAMDGPYNLASGYAIGLWTTRAMDVTGLAFGVMWSEGGQGRMGVAPWQDPQRYIQNSPLFYADKIHTPLMLIHGNDDFVNVTEGEQMYNALQRQGKDAVFVRYWGEGHVYRSPANIRDMWNRIFEWFDTHMDIARDAEGNVLFDGQRVQSRKP